MQTSLARYLPQLLVRLRVWEAASEILGGGGNNAWAIQLHSQYAFDPRCRPLYNLPVTVGYCIGINRVHSKLRRVNREGIAITKKPFLVLTSKGDDVLNGDQTMACAHANGSFPHTLDCQWVLPPHPGLPSIAIDCRRVLPSSGAHAIGPSRTLVSLTYARHDVFISAEKQVTLSALAHVGTWLDLQA